MPGPYPGSFDSLVRPTDGTTNVDAAWADPITDAVTNLETTVGLTGDTASATGTLIAKIKQLQADMDTVYGIALWGGGD